jgi:Flp pilus assembly protein TadD
MTIWATTTKPSPPISAPSHSTPSTLSAQRVGERVLSVGQIRRSHRRLSARHPTRPQVRRAAPRVGERVLSVGQIRRSHRRLSARHRNSTPSLPRRTTGWGTCIISWANTTKPSPPISAPSQLDPKDAYPHNGLGNVYSQLGKYDEAIAAYQRAIQLDPKYAYPHNGLGNVYYQLGKYDDAIAAYQRAIALDPKYATPHNGLGNVYQLLGQYEKALSAYQKAVELAPEGGAYRASLASVLRKLGREAEAQAQMEIARPLMAKENEYNRACFESICGNVEQALALLKVALEKKQTSQEWARRDPDFDSIREDPGFKALVGL